MLLTYCSSAVLVGNNIYYTHSSSVITHTNWIRVRKWLGRYRFLFFTHRRTDDHHYDTLNRVKNNPYSFFIVCALHTRTVYWIIMYKFIIIYIVRGACCILHTCNFATIFFKKYFFLYVFLKLFFYANVCFTIWMQKYGMVLF